MINGLVCTVKIGCVLGVTLNIYFLCAWERIRERKSRAIKTCDLLLSRKFLSTLQPISAPSEDGEDTSEVKGWSNSYFCKPPKTTHTDPKSSQLTSDLFISCQKVAASVTELAGVYALCQDLWMNRRAKAGRASWLAAVCVDGTSCQKMSDFPCSHSWALWRFGKLALVKGMLGETL